MSEVQIFRVIVRGRFGDLTDAARASLAANQQEHDVTLSAFTQEGTLTYDRQIDAFGLRYEIRLEADQPEALAGAMAQREAEQFLSTMGYPHGQLRVSTMAMADLWSPAQD